VTFAHAAIFQDIDVFARAAAQVTASKARDGPADGLVGAAKVQQVLLGLVRGEQHHTGFGKRALTARGDAEQAFERVDARPGATPVIVTFPLEFCLQRLRHAPTVSETELREHGASRAETKVFDQVLAQESHGDGVDQKRSLSGKADRAALRIELQELFVVQVISAHRRAPSI
jgi:hypothetical protein